MTADLPRTSAYLSGPDELEVYDIKKDPEAKFQGTDRRYWLYKK